MRREPENSVEYLVYRLQGHFEISEDNVKKIGQILYKTYDVEYVGANADLLALQASELSEEEFKHLLPEFPMGVLQCLDDIPV